LPASKPTSAKLTLGAQELGRELIGRPTARLWVRSAAPDVDVYVYLEAVHRRGGARINASGVLRASHRKTAPAPYDTGGAPWHSHLHADAAALPQITAAPLDIGLTATAYALQPGDRLRLSVTTRSPRAIDSTPAQGA
jgi:predicted acyl esterase